MALESKGADDDRSPANVGKCVAAIVRGYQDIAAGVIVEFAKAIKVRLQFSVVFSLI